MAALDSRRVERRSLGTTLRSAGALPTSPKAAAPPRDLPVPGDFSLRLRRHEEQRHAGILLLDGPGAPRSSLPPGWRAEDSLRPQSRGFLPLPQAAEAMGATEDDVIDLARRGLLLAELRGMTLYVQPAIVTVTSVVDRRQG